MTTDRDRRTSVAVRPGAEIVARPRLFAALEAAFPVSFEDAAVSLDAEALIEICSGDAFPSRECLARAGLPTLAIGGRPRRGAHPKAVRLSDCVHVDRRIRGISVLDPLDGPDLGPVDRSGEILAAAGSSPAWTTWDGPASIDRVRSSLPELRPDQALRDLLAERTLTVVALVQFLRAVTEKQSFVSPRLRATILFDDPNLRWRTYGFIDYPALLEHADTHGYHAAMAMIPLDGWRQHRATVDLFRKRPDRLSLAYHGNNHLSRELMQPGSEGGAIAIAAQAMRRAASFEARYGLRMDRVMTPPHGMCSASSARALGSLGYDALCAIHPFPWSEKAPAGRPLAGWDPAEFAGGSAVIPRIHLKTGFSEMALRAFLGHPLVLYGHHEDLAGGLDLLAETVSRVNRLGDVQWTSLGEIAATNHAAKLEGDVVRVRPYSHRLRVNVPEGVSSLVVEQPRAPDHRLAGWATAGSPPVPFDSSLTCEAGICEVRLQPIAAISAADVPTPAPRLWPIVRRAATETRDRLRPLLPAGSA